MGLLKEIDTSDLPNIIREDIQKAEKRYIQNDLNGAITSICGAIDILVADVYNKRSLGDSRFASFQEKVSKSFRTYERSFKINMRVSTLKNNKIKGLWENYFKSVHQASYVLGTFRNEFSDAHGSKFIPREFFRIAVDCGIFILKSFTLQEKIYRIKHPYDEISPETKEFLANHFVKDQGSKLLYCSPDELNKEFKKIGFATTDKRMLKRKKIVSDSNDLTTDGIKIIKEIARGLTSSNR